MDTQTCMSERGSSVGRFLSAFRDGETVRGVSGCFVAWVQGDPAPVSHYLRAAPLYATPHNFDSERQENWGARFVELSRQS